MKIQKISLYNQQKIRFCSDQYDYGTEYNQVSIKDAAAFAFGAYILMLLAGVVISKNEKMIKKISKNIKNPNLNFLA